MIKTPNLPIKHIRAEFKAAKEKLDADRMEKMFFALLWQYNKLKKIHAQRISRIKTDKTEVRSPK
jgi:hypothetical protein